MPRYRHHASASVQEEVDALVETSLVLARDQLVRSAAFGPFAVAVTVDGELQTFTTDPSLADRVTTSEALGLLYASAAADDDGVVGFGFVSQVLLDGAVAVLVEVEHHEGPALRLHVPYRRTGTTRAGVELEDVRLSSWERRIWP